MLVLPESPAEVSADRVGRNRGRHFEAHTHELPGVDAEPARLTRRARTGALEDCDARGRGREQRERRATSEHAAGLDPHEPPSRFRDATLLFGRSRHRLLLRAPADRSRHALRLSGKTRRKARN